MGIDFSHCDAHWAYSGFMRFRNKLAEQVGIPDYYKIERTDDPRFDLINKDSIRFLLAHSDCDGILTARECRKVAPRLRELVATWPDTDTDKAKGIKLAEGMEAAAANSQPLRFQ